MLSTNEIHAQITVRMANVLVLVAKGHTQEEIAAELGMAPNTVRNEIEHAKSLTGCEHQRELGRWWLEHRWGWFRWLAEKLEIDPGGLAPT